MRNIIYYVEVAIAAACGCCLQWGLTGIIVKNMLEQRNEVPLLLLSCLNGMTCLY